MNESDSTLSPWGGNLWLDSGMVAYMGPGGTAETHAHHAIQLIRSFDSPFILTIAGDRFSSRAALIPSGVPHSFETDSERLLLTLIEPLGPRGSQIEEVALKSPGRETKALMEIGGPLEAQNGIALALRLVEEIAPEHAAPAGISDHVLAALEYLGRNLGGKPELNEAAASANISPSRLTHLFTEQIGIPFRSYVLWLRLRTVADLVAGGSNLTEAAITAGFSDSSHLSRVFKDSFGLSPSALLRMEVTDGWPA